MEVRKLGYALTLYTPAGQSYWCAEKRRWVVQFSAATAFLTLDQLLRGCVTLRHAGELADGATLGICVIEETTALKDLI